MKRRTDGKKEWIKTECHHLSRVMRANEALQRSRPLLRFWQKLKVLVWGLAAEGKRSPFASLRENAALSGSCLPSAPLRENQALETDPPSGDRSAPR